MLTPHENRRALNLLRTAIRDHYSYRDRLKIDWDKLLKDNEDSLLAARRRPISRDLPAQFLPAAEDKHIWFQVGDQNFPSFVRPSVPNANYKLLAKLVPN